MDRHIGQSLGVTKQATSTPPPEHLPFAADSKRLLELSLREALLLGHNYIGTEHMLLAMLKDTGGTAGQLLVDLGMDGEKTQQWIVAELRGNSKP